MKGKEWIISENLRCYALAWSRIRPRQFSLGLSANYHASKSPSLASMNIPAWLFIEASLVIVTVQLRVTMGKQERVL